MIISKKPKKQKKTKQISKVNEEQNETCEKNIHTNKHYYIEAYLIGVYYASDAKQSKTKQNLKKRK